jgi:hypothetical protein
VPRRSVTRIDEPEVTMPQRSYTDDDLVLAVASSRSWSGVLRRLGHQATSAGAQRSVRRRADELGLDHTHFTGQRRWSEDELAAAVASSRTWRQVAAALGLAGGSSAAALRGHAARLGIDTAHLHRRAPTDVPSLVVDPTQLPRAGGLIAAAWFTLCGYEVSWPLEPCRYDLMAIRGGQCLRIQVKTTRCLSQGSWRVSLTTGGRHRAAYDPNDIDHFFVVAADATLYLIPLVAVSGVSTIHLSAYQEFKLSQPALQPT